MFWFVTLDRAESCHKLETATIYVTWGKDKKVGAVRDPKPVFRILTAPVESQMRAEIIG